MKRFLQQAVLLLSFFATANAEQLKLKYSTNYLMPAYIDFQLENGQYQIQSKINIPFYNIEFTAKGYQKNERFVMTSYRDKRNGKNYALAELDSNHIQYGKINELAKEKLTLPTFDLFTLAFQLSYYDKLPTDFQTTNGKRLYPSLNVILDRSTRQIQQKKQSVEEITYRFKTGNKYITVKKWTGEKFPRYIAYDRDGDHYELTFERVVK